MSGSQPRPEDPRVSISVVEVAMKDISTASLADLVAEIERRKQSMSEDDRCTGIAASWCPRCGACECPRDECGIRYDRCDDGCPLHSPRSPHGGSP